MNEVTLESDAPAEVGGSVRRTWVLAAVGAAVAVACVILICFLAGGPVDVAVWSLPDRTAPAAPDPNAVGRLLKQIPIGLVVIVDTARGRLQVVRDGVVLRDAACSAGSGTILREPGDRVWTFDTPLGERRVVYKQRNPVWTKPDWAFVEEGTLPPSNPADRRDDVSLGDYSLSLGDGYLIHGTLFQSLLGQPVTHGCIRLGDEDLEYVWRTVQVGTRVLLY
jgi:L,D-transpeptidase YbiS